MRQGPGAWRPPGRCPVSRRFSPAARTRFDSAPHDAQAFGAPAPGLRGAPVEGVRCLGPRPPAGARNPKGASWQANRRAVSSGRGPTATVDAEVVPRPPLVKGNRRTAGDHEHVPCDLRTNCCYISMTTRPGRHCGHTAAETRPGDPPRTRTRHVRSCDWAQAARPCSWHPGVCPLAVPLSVGRWPRPGRAGGLAEPERAGGTGAEWDEGEGTLGG